MTLADFIDAVQAQRKTLVVYASDDASDVTSQFETRNVTVERKSLAAGGPAGFAVLQEDGEFVAAFGLAELRALLSLPVVPPWDYEDVPRPWWAVHEALSDTLFTSFDRRQLLGATREVEHRAWRLGNGTVRVGFQFAEAYRDQLETYRRLADETDLTIHVYLADEWDGEAVDGVHVFPSEGEEIDSHWFVVYDAGGDPANACAILARERDAGSFFGFWTYDADRIAEMATYLRRTYE